MKVLQNGYKEYKRYYAIPHDADETQLVRNTQYLHLPLRSHGQEGEAALLLNTLSSELLVLNEQEEEWWLQTEEGVDIGNVSDEAQRAFFRQLSGHDFLVSPTVDVALIHERGRKVARARLEREFSLIEGYTSYTILTTTECNARCFYCYEKGRHTIKMTPETALEVAQFVERNYRINKVNPALHWFGGEPLYNVEVIDIICDYLNAHEVPFTSSMISNAYLFTPDIQKRAVDNWHLEGVQVTLDGLEERYNRTKAYIYKGGESPYQRVLANILSAGEKDIHVSIRVNVDLHNIDELTTLADEIKERIGDRKANITMYSHALFDISAHMHGEQRDAIVAMAQFRLMHHLMKLKLLRFKGEMKEPKVAWCMSDNVNSVVIQPDGMFGKCEHYTDTKHFSDLKGSFFDEAQYKEFFEIIDRIPECLRCPILAHCYRLKICENGGETCKPYELKGRTNQVKASMLYAYKMYREKGKALKDAPPAIADGMKIHDMARLQASAPADIWANSHAEYAATLPEGTWAMNFVSTFEMGNHPIQNMSVSRLDHTSATAKLCGDTSALRQSLSAIAKAYFNEHPNDILVMHQKPAEQRLTARWHSALCTDDSVRMLQGETKNKDGELIQLSVFVDRRCEDFDIVCEALSEQYEALIDPLP